MAVLKQGKMVAEGDVGNLLGDNKTVKLRVSSPNQTVQLLQQLSGCRDIRSNGAYVTVLGLPSESVVAHLVSNGIIPAEVKTGQSDLESIYLQLTNGESMEVANVLDHVLEPVMD
ncbi:hypothetical protein ACFLUA_02085 [Chloroflexota bacterium]